MRCNRGRALAMARNLVGVDVLERLVHELENSRRDGQREQLSRRTRLPRRVTWDSGVDRRPT